jgi:glycosyltransferase involved in cell wall biosynthesis
MSATSDSLRDCRVLVVAAFSAPFIEDDIALLKTRYRVLPMIGHGLRHAFAVFGRVFRSDVLVCWFGSVYAGVAVLASRIAGVPSIVIVAGVDAAKDPEFGYGIWLSPWRSRFVRYAYRHADAVLVVDPSLERPVATLAGYDGANIRTVPFGFDTEFWKPLGEKERSVLTVSVVRDVTTLRRKGIDTLVEAARRLPDIPFTVVGVSPEMAQAAGAPANVRFVAPVPREELLHYYRRAKVYAQPSRREGLPNALCEAMLAGCIPVVSDVNGNPTAAGDVGYCLPPGNGEELAAAILRALMLEEESSARARSRIVSLFPRDRRARELTRIIEGLAG